MTSEAKQRVLSAVREIGDDGWPVTVREIMRATGTSSPSTIQAHLADLERAGLIDRNPRGAGVRAAAA